MFSYYHEWDINSKITRDSLENNVFISIHCGEFSYAEIPSKFQSIMGVTGTLKSLGQNQKFIIENIYKINKNTFIPSVFGENKRKFAEKSDVFVENSD